MADVLTKDNEMSLEAKEGLKLNNPIASYPFGYTEHLKAPSFYTGLTSFSLFLNGISLS
jgi:hypothetical protein